MKKHLAKATHLAPRAYVGVAVAVIVAGIGLYFTFGTKAAGPFDALEAESAMRSGNATIGADPTASGGQYLQFNAPTK